MTEEAWKIGQIDVVRCGAIINTLGLSRVTLFYQNVRGAFYGGERTYKEAATAAFRFHSGRSVLFGEDHVQR